MLNPFLEPSPNRLRAGLVPSEPDENGIENSKDTDRFISTYSIRHTKKNYSTITYIFNGLIYLLEILTATIGGTNDNKNIGLFNSGLILQYFLMSAGIYSILGLIAIYQFNLKVYKNKLYFMFYDFIKICWICIGYGILFGYNQLKDCNFIIGYSMFYILYSTLYVIFSFRIH